MPDYNIQQILDQMDSMQRDLDDAIFQIQQLKQAQLAFPVSLPAQSTLGITQQVQQETAFFNQLTSKYIQLSTCFESLDGWIQQDDTKITLSYQGVIIETGAVAGDENFIAKGMTNAGELTFYSPARFSCLVNVQTNDNDGVVYATTGGIGNFDDAYWGFKIVGPTIYGIAVNNSAGVAKTIVSAPIGSFDDVSFGPYRLDALFYPGSKIVFRAYRNNLDSDYNFVGGQTLISQQEIENPFEINSYASSPILYAFYVKTNVNSLHAALVTYMSLVKEVPKYNSPGG